MPHRCLKRRTLAAGRYRLTLFSRGWQSSTTLGRHPEKQRGSDGGKSPPVGCSQSWPTRTKKKVQQLLRQADPLPPPSRQLRKPHPTALSLLAAAARTACPSGPAKVCRRGRGKAIKRPSPANPFLQKASSVAKRLVLFLAAVWHVNIKPSCGYLCVLKYYSTIKEVFVQRFKPRKGVTPKGLAHWRSPTLCSSADEQRNPLR